LQTLSKLLLMQCYKDKEEDMTTTQVNESSSTLGNFGTFQPGTMSVCSSQLLQLAEVYTEISQAYGDQTLNSLNEQNVAAKASQLDYEKMGENEALASTMTGIGEITSGAIIGGTAAYDAISTPSEQSEIDSLNQNIDNAKTYRSACEERLKNPPGTPLTTQNTEETPSQIKQLKQPGFNFGESKISDSERNNISTADGQDIQGKEGIISNVDSYISKQEDQKAQLQRQIGNKTNTRTTYAQGFSSIFKGSFDSIAGHYKYESSVWQGQQTLASNALQNAQKATDNATSQYQSTEQEMFAVYNSMEQINQANGYK